MKKNIYLLLTSILFIALIILGIYLVVTYRTNRAKNSFQGVNFEKTESLQFQKKSLIDNIYFPTIANGSNILFWNDAQQTFELYDLNNKQRTKVLSIEIATKVRQVIYSPNNKMAIIQTDVPKKGYLDNIFVDFDNKIIKHLDPYIMNLGWSFDSQKIVYHYFNWEKNINQIAISDPNNSNWENIANVDCDNCQVGWISQNEIYYSSIPYEAMGVDVYKINIQTKQKSKLFNSSQYGRVKFYQKNAALYEIYDSDKQQYYLGYLVGNKSSDLNLPGTVDQTVISNDQKVAITIFWNNNSNSNELVKVDLINNKLTLIEIKNAPSHLNISNLIINDSNSTLFFTISNSLYSLDLQR